MEDYRDKVEEGDSKFLSFLTKIVPGYGGYRDREMRREADRLLREAILARLKKAEKGLSKLRGKFNPISEGEQLLAAEGLMGRLETISDRLRYAKYGYTGAFASIKIDPDKLDHLYEYDETLMKKAEAIVEASHGDTNAGDIFTTVTEALDVLEDALDKRERLLVEE